MGGCTADHPRRCGENLVLFRLRAVHMGSPPQVRGKRRLIDAAVIYAGITPAGAGKTRRSAARSLPPEDHPRRCGENDNDCPVYSTASGSPPQVRGKRLFRIIGVARRRITPAGAGKTRTEPEYTYVA